MQWYDDELKIQNTINPSHKSHSALDKYPTMHNFVAHVHISVTKLCIMGYGTAAFSDLCNRSIEYNMVKIPTVIMISSGPKQFVVNIGITW